MGIYQSEGWLTCVYVYSMCMRWVRGLGNGREIILYYGTGRGPTGNVPGMLYALKGSVIIAVGSKIPLCLCLDIE